jgi:hypothetical protein
VNGESLAIVWSATAPYVPQLKTAVVFEGVRYVVCGIESEMVDRPASLAPAGVERDWVIVVKLAKE